VTAAYRDVLSIRDVRALIGASAASQIGNWLYNAALLGYVYGATHSAAWVGAATICRLMPYVLLGPWGGAIADRYPWRTVLLAGDLLRLGLMGVLAGVVAASGPVAAVIGLTALASAAGSAERPAALALLPRLVGETRLGAANALLHTVQDLGVVIGPAEPGGLVIDGDVDDLGVEDVADPLPDGVVDGLELELPGQRFLDAVDQRQLGVALARLLDRPRPR
jgi:MFS family permease